MKTKVFDSIYLLATLAGLYPAVFLVSNNWFFIGASQSVYVVLTLVSLSILAISLLHWSLSLVRVPPALARNAVFFLAVYLLAGYFDFLIVDIQRRYDVDVHGLILLLVAPVAGIVLLRSWKGAKAVDLVKPFNIGLSILTALAIGTLASSVLLNYHNAVSASSEDPKAIERYNHVQFKSRPNIYLIIPDGYPSNRSLKKFFHYDNSGFTDELTKFGFRNYDDYFSAYPSTLESVYSIFSMQQDYYRRSTERDAVGLRELIAGKNDVIRILRNNGYKSSFIHEWPYVFQDSCSVERCSPQRTFYETFRTTLQSFYFFDRLPEPMRTYDGFVEMKRQIDKTNEGDKSFVYAHYYSTHSPKDFDDVQESYRTAFKAAFPGRIEKTNNILLEQIRHISSKDPSAVIIITADHGTWAGVTRPESGFAEDETLDKFGVFLAIKWGRDYDGRYDGQMKSSVNLFRYVFASLSQSDEILATKADDASYLRRDRVWKVVDAGRVLENPEPYTERP